ncbi:hypothetical protein M153_46190001451, partial [Pseudoloma neurophilia]
NKKVKNHSAFKLLRLLMKNMEIPPFTYRSVSGILCYNCKILKYLKKEQINYAIIEIERKNIEAFLSDQKLIRYFQQFHDSPCCNSSKPSIFKTFNFFSDCKCLVLHLDNPYYKKCDIPLKVVVRDVHCKFVLLGCLLKYKGSDFYLFKKDHVWYLQANEFFKILDIDEFLKANSERIMICFYLKSLYNIS